MKDADEVRVRPLNYQLYKRMFRYTGPYRRILVLLLIACTARAIQGPLLAWTLASVISGPIAANNLPMMLWAVAGYASLSALTYWTLYHRQRLALLLGEGVVHDLRNHIFEHLQVLTMGFFNKTKIGRIISRMLSDAEAVRTGVQDAVFVGLVNGGTVLVAASIMLWTDASLFTIVLLMAPFYLVAHRFFKSRIIKARREVQESFSRVTANLAESVSGIRVTQGFVRQDLNAQMFGDLIVDHSGYNYNAAKASGTFQPVLEFIGQILIALIFVVGGYRALNEGAVDSWRPLMAFYFLANLMLSPLASLGNQYTHAITAMAGAERVFTLLDRKPEFVDEPDAHDLPPIQGKVEFRQLTFGYDPAKPVLHDVNFTAKPGQTIALVGHTGSGKSSIINLISKFYLPTSGQILIDGHDIQRVRSESLHRQMGIVLQMNFLFSGSVMDNIRVGKLNASNEDVIEAARRLDTLDLIAALPDGFDTQVGERGGNLSVGQRQLVCFTRAMLANPRIMILDEATSAVDTMTEARIQRSLSLLLKDRTSFVVAHRLSTIRHADVVLVLDHGRIVERGTHNDLLATGGVYANLYMQFIKASNE